ncbi:VanZ family protein [Eggerthella sp. YY7918]|uniref:VanZ family protein n=1 Tax=Eggerthella sp. (strain YY7918) TaxID=502558 RepID=UPI0002171813|nr:VanZ family protein [Eggerthella sp. YY7918]BAK44541.1 hypothetical protein EGYY_13900 [Eggerthella sp. YY7918]
MLEWVILAYGFAAAFLPFLVAYVVVHVYARRTMRTASRLLPTILFALYIYCVIYITGTGTIYDIVRSVAGYAPMLHVNLIPFSEGIGASAILNALMFVPLGFMLPLIWPRAARALSTTGFAFTFSLVIELSQLLNNRSTDIDDLIMNTLGALIGFALFKLVRFILSSGSGMPTRTARVSSSASFSPSAILPGLGEPALYVAVMFAGTFLLYNGLGAVNLVYDMNIGILPPGF